MAAKTLPFDRPLIDRIISDHPTPFVLYHEDGIRQRVRDLTAAFAWNEGFQQYFAVKATPNPHIVALMAEEGSGADCSSVAELITCERLGITGHDVMFTSNNTTTEEFAIAARLGAIINLDTPHHIDQLLQLEQMPEMVSFRFNPGPERQGNVIIGDPKEAKFGCTREQIFEGYARCAELGVTRFGLHAMVVSNELNVDALLQTAEMLFDLAVQIHEQTGVAVECINLGGGIGVAYRPEQDEIDIAEFGRGVQALYEAKLTPSALPPVRLMMENGRAMTGPFGFLITEVINQKTSYKNYVGVDACMSNLMRPGMYGAYHHISVLGKENAPAEKTVDVVGSLCENNDKFAIDRELPQTEVGDILVIHDAGAHGHSMGFQYNGRLRSAEILFNNAGDVREIRRAENFDDYFATVDFASVQCNRKQTAPAL
ncbi:diaminopimelate decarboxylase [Aporhodopirellula aestuarii]|uniref:Diaminopimelate decarboxylase n=1 Tax=Aporhodopirellula aestuarii TaxID=2950107 RepID=A0ABT0UBG4_9BACT|nr:diaminopimelate decarboxylase [Aporhodopirellula aestuarii]MCM2374206.1 diaminopimelate decarboxylase [Aporhodopirellula aestuarii]